MASRKNRRNITGGEIHLASIDPNDHLDENATQDSDNLLKVLDSKPDQTRIFIESNKYQIIDLNDGSFVAINQQVLKRKIKMMEDQQNKTDEGIDQLNILNDLIHEVCKMLDRFIFFFQGLLTGMTITHLVMLFLNSNNQTLFQSYSEIALRLDQVFHILLFISCFGSLFVCSQLNEQANISKKAKDRRYYVQSILSASFYTIAYIVFIFIHPVVGRVAALLGDAAQSSNFSATVNNYNTNWTNFSFSSDVATWKYLQVLIAVVQIKYNQACIFGWFVSVSTTESNLNYHATVEIEEQHKI